MAYALQPDMRPVPPWLKRTVALGAVVIAILVLGLVNHARRVPPLLVLSGPHHQMEYPRAVERLIASARRRIWMSMFVVHLDGSDGPVSVLMQSLADAAGRGVHVQVCLDLGSTFGTHEVDPKHERPFEWLRTHGVHVLVDEPDRTSHAKVLIIDDARVVIGSHNWTRDALTGNREASVLMEDAAAARGLSDLLRTVPGWDADY
ncbi:MAG: hypothetical protein H0W83_14360 [Planctomycetes bacterium]|nr:hypothetical protein [Planctomycetota bacterium]